MLNGKVLFAIIYSYTSNISWHFFFFNPLNNLYLQHCCVVFPCFFIFFLYQQWKIFGRGFYYSDNVCSLQSVSVLHSPNWFSASHMTEKKNSFIGAIQNRSQILRTYFTAPYIYFFEHHTCIFCALTPFPRRLQPFKRCQMAGAVVGFMIAWLPWFAVMAITWSESSPQSQEAIKSFPLSIGNCAESALGACSRRGCVCKLVWKYTTTLCQGPSTKMLHICVMLVPWG